MTRFEKLFLVVFALGAYINLYEELSPGSEWLDRLDVGAQLGVAALLAVVSDRVLRWRDSK